MCSCFDFLDEINPKDFERGKYYLNSSNNILGVPDETSVDIVDIINYMFSEVPVEEKEEDKYGDDTIEKILQFLLYSNRDRIKSLLIPQWRGCHGTKDLMTKPKSLYFDKEYNLHEQEDTDRKSILEIIDDDEKWNVLKDKVIIWASNIDLEEYFNDYND